jgi:hypothetical protein
VCVYAGGALVFRVTWNAQLALMRMSQARVPLTLVSARSWSSSAGGMGADSSNRRMSSNKV